MYIQNNEVTLLKYQATLTSSSQLRFELRSCRGQNLWYTLDREQASMQQMWGQHTLKKLMETVL